MGRTCVWVSAFRNSVIHKILSEFLQPFRYVGIIHSHFYLVLVGLFNNSSDVSKEYGSLRTCLSTLSLDTIAGGWSEWSISVEDVMGVEMDELEEELVVKPGTTIGTKFSVLQCVPIPFLMRRGFWPLIHSYEYPCSSQSFPGDKTAGVSSRTTFIVKNIPNSLT